ncbi:MAG: hypothetical protein WCZ65_03825 [Lysobacteraceae bacterium]
MTDNGKKLWWGALALLLAGIGAAVGWFSHALRVEPETLSELTRSPQSVQAEVDIDVARAAVLRMDRPARPTAVTMAQTPILPREATALEALELLRAPAQRGDPVAACELAQILGECRMRRVMRRMPQRSAPSDVGSREFEAYVNAEAVRQEWQDRLEKRCEGVTAEHLSQGMGYLARAAVAGHAASLSSFMSAPQVAAADFLRDPTLAMVYRSQLWPALRDGLRSGNLMLTYGFLRQMAQGESAPLAAVVPAEFRDPKVAEALRQRLDVRDPRFPGMRPESPAPTPADEAEAERWIRDLFGGELPGQQLEIRPLEAPSPARDDNRAATCRDAGQWLGSP